MKTGISCLKSLINPRFYSTRLDNYFRLFPQTFPNGGPPKESFLIKERQLRRELRQLQSTNHPDMIAQEAISGSNASAVQAKGELQISALLNKAFTTISNPYTRIAHVIQLYHPGHIDITQDDISKTLISKFQNEDAEFAMSYKELLLSVLDAHESLEMATTEEDLEELDAQNMERMKETEKAIDKQLGENPQWNQILIDAIKLKYWVNIAHGIKEWEPGKPVHLTH